MRIKKIPGVYPATIAAAIKDASFKKEDGSIMTQSEINRQIDETYLARKSRLEAIENLAMSAYGELVIDMNDSYGDTASIALNAIRNKWVKGDIVWSHNLTAGIAEIHDSVLVFKQHYVGNVTVTAKADNAEASHTFSVVCDETATSVEYSVLNVRMQYTEVEASATSMLVYYTGRTTTHYPLKPDTVSDQTNLSKSVSFSVNNSSNAVTRSGSFTWNNKTVNWSVKQKAFVPLGPATSGGDVNVDLNSQWVASTKTLSGYNVYMSNSNYNVNSGYASMKVTFKNCPNFKLYINSYAESSYDYTIAWNMDKAAPTSLPSSSTSGVKAHTQSKQYNPTSISNFTLVEYPNDGGEHFVWITYRKDGSVNSSDDRGYVAIPTELFGEVEYVTKVHPDVGKILCSDGTIVTPSIAADGVTVNSVSLGGKTPIGICVIPANHMDDGKARYMSLDWMSYSTPESGKQSSSLIYWGYSSLDISTLPNKTTVPLKSGSTKYYGNLGSRTQLTASFVYDSSDGLYYYNNSYKIPAPFNPNGTINTTYRTSGTAAADFDGKGNTDKIIAVTTANWSGSTITHSSSSGNYPAACCCRRYKTVGTNAGDWYLPSLGELGYLLYNIQLINNILTKIGKAIVSITINALWSSTEYSSYYTMGLYLYDGYVNNYLKGSSSLVRSFLSR